MVNGLLHNEQAFAVLIMGFIDLHIVATCSCACILGVINSNRSLRSSQLALHRSTPGSKSQKLQVLSAFCLAPEDHEGQHSFHSGSSPT